MRRSKPFWKLSLATRRTRRFASTALPLLVILVILPLVFPASAASAHTAQRFAAQAAGCSSPGDCLSKMTLLEKEGQMTQVSPAGVSDIATV